MTAKPRNHEPQSLKETLYRVIFESDTRAGRLFDRILIFVILFSILVVVLDSVQSISAKFHTILFSLEWFFTFIFTIEYIARLYCAPDRRKYALSFFGAAVDQCPAFVGIAVGDVGNGGFCVC
ncbi:MAG: ion transporter, partial [Burkholderiaceae bacterium]|nr:ion transporter [Burkholderiaceae bacterium]